MPQAAEVVSRRGDTLPIPETKPLREMHRAGAIGRCCIFGYLQATPKAGDGEQGLNQHRCLQRFTGNSIGDSVYFLLERLRYGVELLQFEVLPVSKPSEKITSLP
ncbi:MAG: hypothetical protein DRJ61_11625 [Acidobacteria bacterium]|nr:MAG: hypothetical protein DRJ61_11625 [Acidobacteriota bacterium]